MAFIELHYHSDVLMHGVTVNVVLPENLSKIYSYAFMNCGTIETMVWPANLNFVEKNAFTNAGAYRKLFSPIL